MEALLRETWERARPQIRERAGTEVFEAWLGDLRPIALERGVLYLEARNRMVSERVDRLYGELIAQCVTEELGTQVSISTEPSPESLLPDRLEVGPGRPVVDASNRTAFLVLRALIEGQELPSKTCLFYGAPGTGKSFLLEWWLGLWRGGMRRFDGPGLTRAFQAALRDRRPEQIVDELASAPALIVDEIHRISGHLRVQRELARVLERRSREDLPTLMASRWHPREIRRLDEGLATWLLSGFVARLDPPGPRGRLAYLRALEGPRSRNGRATAVEKLARNVHGSFPDLRRAWAVERLAGPHQRARYWDLIEPRSAFARLCDRVAAQLGIPVEELTGRSQNRRASQARKILALLCIREGLNRAEVGRFLGRTRAAISYSIKSLEAEMAQNEALRRQVETLG